MRRTYRQQLSILSGLAVLAALVPLDADACAPGWTSYRVVAEHTPACFSFMGSGGHREDMYVPIQLYNDCPSDMTIEPMKGLCSGCKEAFVMAPGESVSLTVSGQNNENTYTWRMEGKSPDLTEEGTIVLESDSVIPDCPGPFGCSTTSGSHGAPWALLPLVLALAFLVRPRRQTHTHR